MKAGETLLIVFLPAFLLAGSESSVFPVASAQNVGGKIQNIVLGQQVQQTGRHGDIVEVLILVTFLRSMETR